MRLGIHVGHWEGEPRDVGALARAAESLGLDSVWVSETWGSDAVVLATAIAVSTERIGVGTAVMQMAGRAPAQAAMAALTLDHLSAGRFRLGLGTSGPQVVEGWYGAPFDDPIGRAREYVEIVRTVLRREEPVVAEGPHYPLPARAGSGLGKPLKSNVRPLRPDPPIYLAAMGPRNVALTAEIADGWVPFLFVPGAAREVYGESLERGFIRRGGRPDRFDVAPMVPCAIGEDVAACRDEVRQTIALYVGGYGAKEANFYRDAIVRAGHAEAAARIQDAFLAGRRTEAAAAVPDALIDEVALVGPVPRVRERLGAYADAGVTTVLPQVRDVATVRALAEAAG
jgi:F420-dependent oxidoreductase-like protein